MAIPDMPPIPPVPLMTPERARDIGRNHHAWAAYLISQDLTVEAERTERQAHWWLAYAMALAQTTKPEGSS